MRTDTGNPVTTIDSDPSIVMGVLELDTYRTHWLASLRFRRRRSETASKRERERAIERAEKEARAAAEKTRRGRGARTRIANQSGNPPPRKSENDLGVDFDLEILPRRKSKADFYPVRPGAVATSLLFSRVFDRRPALLDAIRTAGPVIVLDVAEAAVLEELVKVWREILFDRTACLMDLSRSTTAPREDLDALYMVVKEQRPASKSSLENATLSMLPFALPLVAISPLARTHLPKVVNDAATDHIDFPSLDPATVARTIRIVTGKACREAIAAEDIARTTLADLEIAIRFDRTPEQCLSELRRLSEAKDAKKKAREFTLSQLHGLGEARAWAESAIAEIQAWKRGEIGWDSVPSAIALNGPPGCGKTTFASVFAAEAGLHFINSTYAKWQSSGDAHLGHLLRAMRSDFEAARARAPSCILLDEVDSFVDRAGVTHSHRDYVIQVVNALLAEVDGIAGKEGVVIIAASNDIGRCDPALLRAGRLERVVQIGLPDIAELEKMFRVRLGQDLRDQDLLPICELAAGMTGADVERFVKDARRLARHNGGRALVLNDLHKVLVEEDDQSDETRWRFCVHEAAHILADVIHFGPHNVFARIAKMKESYGMSVRSKVDFVGTPEDYRRRLQVILAGRTGEELVFGSASHGSGGTPGSDLDTATRLASAMVGSLGVAGPTPLIYLGPAREAGGFLKFAKVRTAVDRELLEAERACTALLSENRAVLEAVARRLAARGRIEGKEVAALLAEQVRHPPVSYDQAVSPHTDGPPQEPRYE